MDMYKQTFNSFSFGCRVNEAEKTAMDTGMLRAGFVQDKLNPDIFMINTCAVTAKAEREARQLILTLKRKNPKLKIVATGCSATYWEKNKLWQNMPIDLLISNLQKDFAVEIIKKRFQPQTEAAESKVKEFTPHDKFLDSGRVMIKLQDGCHRFCTYCIVPYLRGLPRTSTIGQLIEQIKGYEGNMSEVILTAINTEAFGKTTGESLVQLIRSLLQKTTIPRFSFGSIHPWSLNQEFIEYYKSNYQNERLSSFFHVPMQSGSNKILSLMKRDYTREEIGEKLALIKHVNPLAFIATDIIVGFLEESDKDFNDTYTFLKASPIHKFHVFRFSSRLNTAAHYMKKRLNEPNHSQKKKRSQALLELSRKKYEAFIENMVGHTFNALFVGDVKDGYQKGLLNNQIPGLIRTNKSLSGRFKHVTITERKKGLLLGELA